MKLYTKFWGVRGSLPTPGAATRRYGGNTCCVEVRSETTSIVCDAGSGIRAFGQDLLRRHPERNAAGHTIHLLLTHTHWDHIQGFPFFNLAYLPTTELHIYDIAESPRYFYSLLSGQMTSDYFPVRFADLRAKIVSQTIAVGKTQIGDITVRAFPHVKHPGGGIAYSFEAGGTKIVYSTDNELELMLVGSGRDVPETEVRQVDPAFVEFVKGADLFIADAQYTEKEYPGRKGWGHSTDRSATDLAIQANVKRLALFHHDPIRSDAEVEDVLTACRARAAKLAPNLVIFPAREGVELAEGKAVDEKEWA